VINAQTSQSFSSPHGISGIFGLVDFGAILDKEVGGVKQVKNAVHKRVWNTEERKET
jgi:hypothetical protein